MRPEGGTFEEDFYFRVSLREDDSVWGDVARSTYRRLGPGPSTSECGRVGRGTGFQACVGGWVESTTTPVHREGRMSESLPDTTHA